MTKDDLDKVRHIEGFPIGADEDIIALSDPPYCTACPNPFLEDFIRAYGTPYNEATNTYHRTLFTLDAEETRLFRVSRGDGTGALHRMCRDAIATASNP